MNWKESRKEGKKGRGGGRESGRKSLSFKRSFCVTCLWLLLLYPHPLTCLLPALTLHSSLPVFFIRTFLSQDLSSWYSCSNFFTCCCFCSWFSLHTHHPPPFPLPVIFLLSLLSFCGSNNSLCLGLWSSLVTFKECCDKISSMTLWVMLLQTADKS